MFEARKFAANTERERLAYFHLAVNLMVKYKVKLGQGRVNPTNYAHQVWRKNRRRVPENFIVTYQDQVEAHIANVKASRDYQHLLNGTATPELIIDTIMRYKFIKKCGG